MIVKFVVAQAIYGPCSATHELMRIYRFRVLIDRESEAFRDIEIGSEQTFLDLHNAIKDAFAFIGQEVGELLCERRSLGQRPGDPASGPGFRGRR